MRCSLLLLVSLSFGLAHVIPSQASESRNPNAVADVHVENDGPNKIDVVNRRKKLAATPLVGPGWSSGIAYSHYTANGQCRSAVAVNTDVKTLIALGHDLIRIYGVDCNGPMNVVNAVRGTNTSVFLGIYDITQAEAQARSIAVQLGNNWTNVNTIAVGNEIVNDGGDPAAVIAAMNIARTTLRSLGYTGPVVTTDTMVAVMNHPELCTSADYCSINCHAFFDGNWPAELAGNFVQMFMNIIRAKIGPTKQIVISESGWPHGGTANGKAIPGVFQQQAAVASLKKAIPTNLILYSAFNEYWLLDNAFTHAAEHYWGIYGNSPGGL